LRWIKRKARRSGVLQVVGPDVNIPLAAVCQVESHASLIGRDCRIGDDSRLADLSQLLACPVYPRELREWSADPQMVDQRSVFGDAEGSPIRGRINAHLFCDHPRLACRDAASGLVPNCYQRAPAVNIDEVFVSISRARPASGKLRLFLGFQIAYINACVRI